MRSRISFGRARIRGVVDGRSRFEGLLVIERPSFEVGLVKK